MSHPIFLHVMSNGDVWVSDQVGETPSGTLVGTFKFSTDGNLRKIGTLSGTAGSNLSQSGANGKQGREI